MSAQDAGLLADSLIHADLRGIHSHGVLRVPEYVAKLTRKGVDPKGSPRVVRDSGAVLVVDGDNSMGQIGCSFAMRTAIERAQTTNLAAVALRGSNHCGAMDFYAMQALPHDMIGLATTNALPTMAPWGGLDKLVGLNPLGVAIPAGKKIPFVLDGAFGMTAHGKIRVYAQKGLAIPPGWAYDPEGKPTTDPAEALAGLIVPIGGYKGVALGMIMGILSSVLSGAGYGSESGNMVDGAIPGKDGQFVMVLKIEAFTDPAEFKARIDKILGEIETSRRAPGVERLYYPGLFEAELEQRYQIEGIPLNAETLKDVVRSAEELGVPTAKIT
jgi:LDH2 family malate/lactate/ureidoglycolate dehydrogenase